jgi:hypothetical protein
MVLAAVYLGEQAQLAPRADKKYINGKQIVNNPEKESIC